MLEVENKARRWNRLCSINWTELLDTCNRFWQKLIENFKTLCNKSFMCFFYLSSLSLSREINHLWKKICIVESQNLDYLAYILQIIEKVFIFFIWSILYYSITAFVKPVRLCFWNLNSIFEPSLKSKLVFFVLKIKSEKPTYKTLNPSSTIPKTIIVLFFRSLKQSVGRCLFLAKRNFATSLDRE